MDVKMKSHLTAVRKSTRTIKKTQRVLESADSSLDDLLENPPKKPRTSSKPRRRNIDYCKDGTPFKCSVCESSYINTSAAKAKKRMEKFPIERERNGTTMLLCVKCSMAITLLDCKKPSAEEREKFEEAGKQFADSWVKLLNEPEACRLYCSLYSSSKCGCIQSYVNGTLALTRKRKNSHSISESGQSDASETVSVSTEPSEQSEPSDRMKYLVSLLKQSQAIKEKLQKKRSFTDEEVNSLNKSLDQFVLSNRVKLMNLGICERGCQRVLCYSNNFLRKKTASYSQARLQKTKLANRLANCIDLQELHKMKCCEKECCLETANSLDKLKEWREQSQVSQNDMWKVIAEMFSSKCTGSQTGHCPKFIKMVTGCCNTTIQKVYFNILLAKGDTRKPEHGMKHHWKRQRKNSTKSCEEVLHSSSKGLAKKMKISRINKDKQQSVTFALTESTHLKPDVTLTESTHLKPVNVTLTESTHLKPVNVTLTESTHLKPVNVTLTEPPQSVALVETKQAVMSTVNNVQLPIEAMPTAAAPVCGQIAAISSEGSPGNQLTMTSLPVAQQVSSMSCLSATPTTESSSQPVDIEQTLKKAIPQLCGNLEDVNSTIKLLELVTGLVEIQRQKDCQQLPQQSLTGLVSRVQTGESSSAALTTSSQLHIQSKVPQPVPAKSGSTMAHSTFLKKNETVTLVSSPSSRASFTDPMCITSMSLRQIQSSAGPPVPATSLGSLITTTINSSQLEPAPVAVSSLDMTHLQAVTIHPAPSQLLGTGNYVQILASNMSQLTSGQPKLVSGKPPPGTTSFILTGQLKPDSYENKDNSAFSSQTSLATLLTSYNPITQTIATCTETQALESNQFLNSSSHFVTSHKAQPSTSFETGFTVLKPPTSDNIVSSDSITQSMSHPPSQQFSLISSNRESNSTAVPGSSSVQHKYTSSFVCGTTSGNLSTNVLDLRDSVNYSSSIIFSDRPVLQTDKSFKPVSNVNVVHSQAKRAILFSDDTSNKGQTNMTYNTVNAPQNSNTINHKSHAVPDSNLSQSPISLTSHLVYNQELQEILAEQRLKTSSGLSLTPLLQNNMPSNIPIETPSSCGSGSSVFDALVDSPLKDSSHQVSPMAHPSTKGSLLCEMLLRTGSLPGMSVFDSHSSPLPISTTSTASESQRLLTFRTIAVSNTNSQNAVNESYIPCSSQRTTENAPTPGQMNGSQVVIPNDLVNQPSLKMNRMYKTRDPPQVGIVNPYISSTLDSVSKQSSLINTLMASGSTVVNEVDDQSRGDQSVVLNQTRHTQRFLNNQPLSTNSVSQAEPISLQAMLKGVHANVPSVAGLFDRQSSSTVSEPKLNVTATAPLEQPVNPVSNEIPNVQSHVMNTASSNSALSQTILIPVSSAGQHSGHLMYSAILCPSNGPIKLVPVMLASDQSMPVFAPSAQPIEEVSVMGAQSHFHQTSNLATATNINPAPRVAMQTSLPSNQSQQFLLSQGTDHQSSSSGVTLSLNNNLHLYLSQSDVLKAQVMPHTSVTQMIPRTQTVQLMPHTQAVSALPTSEQAILPFGNLASLALPSQSLGTVHQSNRQTKSSVIYISGQESLLGTGQSTISTGLQIPKQKLSSGSASFSTLSLESSSEEESKVFTNATSLPETLNQVKNSSTFSLIHAPQVVMNAEVTPHESQPIVGNGKWSLSKPEMGRFSEDTQDAYLTQNVQLHSLRSDVPKLSTNKGANVIDSQTVLPISVQNSSSLVQNSSSLVQNTTSVVLDSNSGNFLLSGNQPRFLGLKSESTVSQTSSALPSQNCTFLLVPDQPNYPTYQIAMNPGDLLTSDGDKCIQNFLSGSLQSQTSAQQTTSQSPKTLLEPSTAFLPLRTHGLETTARSREDTMQPDFYNKITITPPSTVSHAEVLSKESGKSSHLPLLLKRPRRTSHISESQLSLQPSEEVKSTYESRFKCTNMFSEGFTTSQQSTDSMSRAKEPNFVKSTSTSVNPVSAVASLYQQNPAIQTGQTILSNTISLPNLTNKPGDVTTIRNREIIDLTLDSPPRTPPSMHSTSVVQADTQQHQLCDKLQKPAPNIAVNNQLCDPSHGNGERNTGTALLSHNILPQILHLSQASKDGAKEFAQELVNVQFVVIAQPNKLPMTFSTGAGTSASQGLSDKALADLISSFASQASANTNMVLQSQAQPSSSANKEMNLELTDFKSKEKEQHTLLPESSTYDLNSQLTIQPSRSVSQTEWSDGLTTAVTNSSTLKPSSSGLSLSFSTTQPISPSMKSSSVPIPCPSKPQLASVVMFTRATNTPSGAVGPPNITVMSPSRLRFEPSTILSAVVTTSQLSVTTSSLVTSTVTTPRAQVSISRSSTGEQANQVFDSSPHYFARSLPLKISTHSKQTSNIRTADLSSLLAKRALPATKNMPAPKPKKNTVLELLKNKELARVASGAVTTSASLSVAVNQHTNVSSLTGTTPFLFKNGPLLINQSSSQAPSLTSNSNIANITLLPANIKTALEPHQLVIRPNALHEAKIAPLGIQIISQVPIQQQTSGCSEGSVLPKLAITPQLQISAAQTANVSKPLLSSEPKLKIISQPRSSLSLLAKPIVSGEKHLTLINSKQSNEASLQKSFVMSDSSGIDHNLIAGPIVPSTSVLQFQKPKLNTSFSSPDAVHSMATSNATFKLKLPSQHVNSNVKQFSERKTLLCTQQDSSPNAILLSSQPIKPQQLSEPQMCKFSFAQPVLTASNPMLSNMLFSNQATLPSSRLPDSSHDVPDGSDHYDQKSHKVNMVNAKPTIARLLRANDPLATPQHTTEMQSGTQSQSSKLTSNFSTISKNISSSTAHQQASSHNSMAGESSKSSFIQSHTKHEKDHFKNGRIDKIINDMYNRGEDAEETLQLEDNQAYFKNSSSATLQLTNMQTSMVQETANMSSNEMIGDLELRQINPNMIEKQTPPLSANASQTWKSPKKVKARKLIPKLNKKCVQFSDQLTKPSTLSSSENSNSTLDKQSQSSSVYPKSFSALERDLIHESPSHHQAHQEKNPSESRLQELLSHDNQQANCASQPRSSLAGHQNVYNDKANQVRSQLVPERCSGYENYFHVFKQHSSEPTEKIAVNTASSLSLTTDVSVWSKSSVPNSSPPSSSDRDQQLPQKVYVMPQDQHQSLDQTQSVHSSFNILSDKGYFKLNNTRKAAALNASNPCLMEDNIMKNVRSFEGNATLTLQPICWTKRSENIQFLSDPHPVQQVSSLPAEENVLAHSYQLAQQMSQGSASFSKDNDPSIETDSPEGSTKPDYAHQFKAERPVYFHRKVEHHRVPSLPSELLHLPSNIFSDSFVEGHLMEPIVAESSMVLQSLSTVTKDISEKKHENKQLRKKIAKIKQKLQKSVSDSNQMSSSTGDVLNEKKFPADVHYQQEGESLKKQPPAGNVNVKQSLQIRGKDHVHAFQGGVPLESETLFSEDSFAGGFTLESKTSHFFDRPESPELCMKDKDPLVSSSSLSRPSSQLEMELAQYDSHARQRYPSSENKSTSFRGIIESDSLLPLTERHRNPSYSQRSSDLDLFNDITYRQRNPSSSSMKSPYTDIDFFSSEFGIRSRHPSTSYMTESFTAIRSRNPSGSSNRRSRPGSSSSDRDFTAIDDWVVAFNDIARTRSRNSSGESLEPTVEPMDHHTMQLYGPQGKH